jgi:nucleoid-associated protein EbfC
MFKNLGNLTQLAGLLKNFGQIKTKIAESKERLTKEVVIGVDESKCVRIDMNGVGVVIGVQVDQNSIQSTQQLEAAIQQAANQAIKQAKQLHVNSIREMTAGVDIPGLDGILQELQ